MSVQSILTISAIIITVYLFYDMQTANNLYDNYLNFAKWQYQLNF